MGLKASRAIEEAEEGTSKARPPAKANRVARAGDKREKPPLVGGRSSK